MATPGPWNVYTTVKLPAEPSPREFDPEFILILSGTVGAGAAPAGVLPAPIAKALYFNVMDYGARGDGITNDYAACQAAATAVSTAGGGVLYIPAGTYLLSQDLLIYSNTYVLGAGRATILKAKASTTTNPLTVSGVSHVIISDLQIDGNKANVTQLTTPYTLLQGIYITNSDDVTVERCYIHDCLAAGIMANGNVTNIFFHKNRLLNCGDNQIYVRAKNVSPYTACAKGTISGNICSGGSYSGIQILGSSYYAITGNTCYSNGPTAGQGDGIGVEGASHVVIAGNVCFSNGVQGIQSRFTNEVGTTQKSSHISITGNECYNNTNAGGDNGGIGVNDSDDVLVSANLVYSNTFGINVNAGSGMGVTNCTLMNNKVRGNADSGIRITAATSGQIYNLINNESADNAADACYSNSRMTVLGGIYKGSTGSGHFGLHLDTGADNTIIDGVNVYDNADNGVHVSGAVTIEVRNSIFDNTGTVQPRAVYEASGGPTRLTNNRIRSQNVEPFHFSNGSSLAKGNDITVNGYLDTNSGSATVTSGQTSVNVTHNLYVTPTRIEITPTTDTLGQRFWVSAKGTTTFTITANTAPGSNVLFDWRAWTS